MKKKKSVKRIGKSKRMSNTKLLFLSFLLLFIVFEALYILKSQQSSLAGKPSRSVAGVTIEK